MDFIKRNINGISNLVSQLWGSLNLNVDYQVGGQKERRKDQGGSMDLVQDCHFIDFASSPKGKGEVIS